MPQHSKGYLERRASIGKTKPIGEHIEHFKQRLKERFDIEFTTNDYNALLSKLVHNTHPYHLYKVNCGTSLIRVEIQGKPVWIIYSGKRNDLPARLKTALIPFKGYIVPDCLSDYFDHKTFSVAINETIEYFIKLAESLNLNDPVKRKEFFTQSSIHKTALAGAYFYIKNNHDRLSLIHLAVRHLKYLNNVDVETDE